ncbi:hypothetical protein T10_12772, partial [Trichinella papuae]
LMMLTMKKRHFKILSISKFVCNQIVKAHILILIFRPSCFHCCCRSVHGQILCLLLFCSYAYNYNYNYNCDCYCCLKKQDPPYRHTLCVVKKFTEKFQNTLHQQ